MNTIVKSAVAGTLALVSTGAFAISMPNTNTSDIILIIQNVNTPADVYALDTGVTINTVFPAGSYVSGAMLDSTAYNGINRTINASSTLTSFLAANPASGDAWQLIGDQYAGNSTAPSTNGNSKQVGNNKAVITSIQPGSNVSGTQLGNLEALANGVQNAVQNTGEFAPLASTNTPVATENSTGVSCVSDCQSKFGYFGAPDLESPLGTSSPLYLITGGGTTTAFNQSYIAGTATLDTAGDLIFAQNSTTAVPLPPAVWLLGSGLLGLVGVSRRRKAVA